MRQIENMTLAVPPHVVATLPERVQELLGYSIMPPFIGYVDGQHPRRILEQGGGLRQETVAPRS
jgi:ectoine hydroxylase-related dioxygenase (phytanoyl-CoA dioxygenase family)